jgi:5-bromo-4-chloroindolyl phosphate hydrolysis protein
MKIILFITLFFAGARCADTTSVYICDSRTAKRYHLRSDCKGLSHCSHRVVKISLEEAKKRGKTLCGLEK